MTERKPDEGRVAERPEGGAERPEKCWTCGGQPSKYKCICDDTGLHVHEVQNMREALLGLRAKAGAPPATTACRDCGITLPPGTAKVFTVCEECWDKAYGKPPATTDEGAAKTTEEAASFITGAVMEGCLPAGDWDVLEEYLAFWLQAAESRAREEARERIETLEQVLHDVVALFNPDGFVFPSYSHDRQGVLAKARAALSGVAQEGPPCCASITFTAGKEHGIGCRRYAAARMGGTE